MSMNECEQRPNEHNPVVGTSTTKWERTSGNERDQRQERVWTSGAKTSIRTKRQVCANKHTTEWNK